MTQQQQKNVHYEVHGLRGSTWTILEVEDEQGPALAAAKKRWDGGHFKAVRVLRELYDTETNTFSSLELFHRGVKRKPSKHDDEPTKLCDKIQDLYSVEGRRTINRLMRQTLDRLNLTAIELLHCSEHYFRLENAGTVVQNAVQRAAVSQVQETGESVQERMKKLYELIGNAVSEMKNAEDAGRFPKLAKGQFRAVVEGIEEKNNRRFLLTAALTHFLKSSERIQDKFSCILSLARHDHHGWIMNVLDDHASEMLLNRRLVESLIKSRSKESDPLLTLAKLIDGQLTPEEEAALPEETRKLNFYLQNRYLQGCRQVLVNTLAEEITGSRHLSGADLMLMARRIRELKDIMTSGREMLVGGLPLSEILIEREARAMNAQTIGHFVKSNDCPLDTIDRLLDLEHYVVGRQNKRSLANFILPILESPENERAFRGIDHKYSTHMKHLATLQRRILDSEMQDTHKRKMAEKLDEYCAFTAKNSGFFKRLSEAPSSPAEKGRNILNLLAQGYFTEGKTATAARAEAKRYLKHPEFFDKLMESVRKDQQPQALQDFKNLLVEAGVAPDLAHDARQDTSISDPGH